MNDGGRLRVGARGVGTGVWGPFEGWQKLASEYAHQGQRRCSDRHDETCTVATSAAPNSDGHPAGVQLTYNT